MLSLGKAVWQPHLSAATYRAYWTLACNYLWWSKVSCRLTRPNYSLLGLLCGTLHEYQGVRKRGGGRGSISGTEHLIKLGHRRESMYNCDWLRNAWRCDLRLIVPSSRWNDPPARLQRAPSNWYLPFQPICAWLKVHVRFKGFNYHLHPPLGWTLLNLVNDTLEGDAALKGTSSQACPIWG